MEVGSRCGFRGGGGLSYLFAGIGIGTGDAEDDPDCHPPLLLDITNGIAAYVNERSQPSGKFCFSVSVSQEIEMVPVETRTDIHPRWIRLGPGTSDWEIFVLRTCSRAQNLNRYVHLLRPSRQPLRR